MHFTPVSFKIQPSQPATAFSATLGDERKDTINIRKASIATTPGTAKAMKFICKGNLAAISVPPRKGPAIAPIRPTPDAQPKPEERMDKG